MVNSIFCIRLLNKFGELNSITKISPGNIHVPLPNHRQESFQPLVQIIGMINSLNLRIVGKSKSNHGAGIFLLYRMMKRNEHSFSSFSHVIRLHFPHLILSHGENSSSGFPFAIYFFTIHGP